MAWHQKGQKPLSEPMVAQCTDAYMGHRHFPDDNYQRIFLNENVWISINISQKFVPMGPIHNIPTLVQVMAWRRPGDKPLSEPMMVRLLTHIFVTWSQWVNPFIPTITKAQSRKHTIPIDSQFTQETPGWTNPLWPRDIIWWQITGSILLPVKACCLMAPSHYLNQSWFIIRNIQWHSF